jgi:hypothetical protein
LHKFNLPRYLDDQDSDFEDFKSVSSEQVKHYEAKYKAMMKNEFKKKEPIYFKIHKKTKKSSSNTPAESI